MDSERPGETAQPGGPLCSTATQPGRVRPRVQVRDSHGVQVSDSHGVQVSGSHRVQVSDSHVTGALANMAGDQVEGVDAGRCR